MSVDHVIAECGRLRTAWGWLRDSTIPGRVRRNQRAISSSAKEQRDKQALAERNDRQKLLGVGKLVTGSTTSPANIAAIEARTRIIGKVEEVAGEITLRVSTVTRNRSYRPDLTDTNVRFTSALNWVSTNIQHVRDEPILNNAYRTLVASTNLAEAVAGAGEERRPLAAECPACGRRALVWVDNSAVPGEHHIRCISEKCRCQGRDCGCNQPDRKPGLVHVWLQPSWERLSRQIREAS